MTDLEAKVLAPQRSSQHLEILGPSSFKTVGRIKKIGVLEIA